MDIATEPVIEHEATPPVDMGISLETVFADILIREPFDLRFLHVEVV